MTKTTLTWYRRLKKHERGKGRWKYIVREEKSVEVSIHLLEPIITDYIILGKTITPGGCKLTCDVGYRWDGPSGPTWDRSQNMRASLFHDALCQLINEGLLDKKYRKYADQLFRQHLLEDGMGKFWAWGYYMAVRAWSKLKGM